jgi:fatty-acyl-CoA synthase
MRAPYSRNLFDLACEQAERYPDRVAVISGETRATYPELLQRARRVAAALRAAGIGRGDRIGMLVNNRIEWVDICLGAAAIGAVPVPFSTWSKRREIDFLLADSRVRMLFAPMSGDQDYAADFTGCSEAGRRYPALETVVILGARRCPAHALRELRFITPPLEELPPPGERAGAGDIAFILYTSGSTAYPKAVPPCTATTESGFNIGERQGLQPGEPVPCPHRSLVPARPTPCARPHHGATLVLQARFEPAETIDLIERHAVALIYTMPAITTAVITHESFRRERTRSLRSAMTIGTQQDIVTVAETLGAREICNVYGQTESYGNCCVTWHHWPLERRMQVRVRPARRPARIVVPTARELPRGSRLIEVKGRLTPGYDGTSSGRTPRRSPPTAFPHWRPGRLTAPGDLQFRRAAAR